MSAFQRGASPQQIAAMMRARPAAEVIDPAAHDRLDALEGRVTALEGAPREDAGEDALEGGSDGE